VEHDAARTLARLLRAVQEHGEQRVREVLERVLEEAPAAGNALANERNTQIRWRPRSDLRNFQLQRLMRPRAVVVTHELAEYAPQVPLVHDDHVVEALASKRTDDSLRDRVCLRGGDRCEHRPVPMRFARPTKSPP
jgi:hypothetical protein